MQVPNNYTTIIYFGELVMKIRHVQPLPPLAGR